MREDLANRTKQKRFIWNVCNLQCLENFSLFMLFILTFWNSKFGLHTTFVQAIRRFFLPSLSCQMEWALGQRVYIRHVSAHFTSSSSIWWTFLWALGAWVGAVAYNHVTVNEHKWMVSNELESFQAKPLCTDWRRCMVLHSIVIWTSDKCKILN